MTKLSVDLGNNAIKYGDLDNGTEGTYSSTVEAASKFDVADAINDGYYAVEYNGKKRIIGAESGLKMDQDDKTVAGDELFFLIIPAMYETMKGIAKNIHTIEMDLCFEVSPDCTEKIRNNYIKMLTGSRIECKVNGEACYFEVNSCKVYPQTQVVVPSNYSDLVRDGITDFIVADCGGGDLKLYRYENMKLVNRVAYVRKMGSNHLMDNIKSNLTALGIRATESQIKRILDGKKVYFPDTEVAETFRQTVLDQAESYAKQIAAEMIRFAKGTDKAFVSVGGTLIMLRKWIEEAGCTIVKDYGVYANSRAGYQIFKSGR